MVREERRERGREGRREWVEKTYCLRSSRWSDKLNASSIVSRMSKLISAKKVVE